jgi:hypothetical protein
VGSNHSMHVRLPTEPPAQRRSPQQPASLVQLPDVTQQVLFSQKPKPNAFPQHSLLAVQERLSRVQQMPKAQVPLQHRLALPAVHPGVPLGRHTGVVEVVLVDVEVVLVDVEVVGVVVLVDVEVVGVVVDVDVEVVGVVVEVLVEVLVVLLVDVLVEVVLVVVVVVPHRPGWSPWSRWRLTALWETSIVSSSGVPGLWQMITFCCRARAREGISAAMAVPAKSLSALRLLIDPSASARARSSKARLVVCWLTCCPLSPKGGTLGD